MDVHDILRQISKDLGIIPFPEEPESQYINRLCYSAISIWAKSISSAPGNSGQNIGVSKASFHRKLNSIISRFSSISADVKMYLCPSDDFDSSNYFRDVLMCSGEIIDVGFSSGIAISKIKRETLDGTGIQAVFGSDSYSFPTHMVGMMSYETGKVLNEPSGVGLLSLFRIPKGSAAEMTHKYLYNAKWEEATDKSDYEYFDQHRKGVISNCWVSWPGSQNDVIGVGRRRLSYGAYEYRMVKTEGNKFFIARFPEYAQMEIVRDTQRVLYGLKATTKDNYKINVDHYNGYSVWHFWSKLPPQEEKLLCYIGWPLHSIENKTNEFIIMDNVNPLVKRIADNLNLDIMEADHE